MRDKETLLAGLMAAETGHLVFATLHTTDTVQAFSRMLEFFPTDQHPFIRSCLANALRAVMAQRLLPSTMADVKVVPATEVLLASPSVSDRIRGGQARKRKKWKKTWRRKSPPQPCPHALPVQRITWELSAMFRKLETIAKFRNQLWRRQLIGCFYK